MSKGSTVKQIVVTLVRNSLFTVPFLVLPSIAFGQSYFTPNFHIFQYETVPVTPCPGGDCGGRSDGALSTSEPSMREQSQAASTTLDLSFVPSQARRRANLANFVEKTRRADPATADKMTAMFASTDIFQAIGDALEPYGLSTNNLADAYAVYWVNAWEATRGIVGSQETRQRAQAVKAQATRSLQSSTQFDLSTDAQKQELAESLFIQAALISAYMEDASGNPTQTQAVGEAVMTGAKRMGIELDTMELTQTGFSMQDQ